MVVVPLTPGQSTTSIIERSVAEQLHLATDRRADAIAADLARARRAPYAEGSCLISFGEHACCAPPPWRGVPGWRKGRGEGWLTAEYAMLPRATRTRTARERAQVGGRTQEIQRLIGRSVRAMLDDFRVRRVHDARRLRRAAGRRRDADGGDHRGLRCGQSMHSTGWSRRAARASPVQASRGGGERRRGRRRACLDLDYEEDVRADVDMNVVMSSEGRFVEVQGTGEHGTFDRARAGRAARSGGARASRRSMPRSASALAR